MYYNTMFMAFMTTIETQQYFVTYGKAIFGTWHSFVRTPTFTSMSKVPSHYQQVTFLSIMSVAWYEPENVLIHTSIHTHIYIYYH